MATKIKQPPRRTLTVLVLPARGKPRLRRLEEYHPGQMLEHLQALVGGGVQMVHVPGDPEGSVWCDEDGKSKGLPINRRATDFCARHGVGFAEWDFLSGTIFFAGGNDGRGNSLDVPHWITEELMPVHLLHAVLSRGAKA